MTYGSFWKNAAFMTPIPVNHLLRWFNSSPPSAAYMHQWIRSSLVQIMASCLFGAKPLPKPVLGYCQLDPYKLQWNNNQNTKLFIHENASENTVCEMAAILSWGRWVYIGNLWYSASQELYAYMMTSSNGNIFCVVGTLCGEFISHQWIPHAKASDAELWCFLWSVPDWMVE